MELSTIETFLKVAASQNISRTAAQMGYSQSAVTVQIRKLEQELGLQLFERIGRRIYLTERGASFIPYANEILKAAQAAQTFAQGAEQPVGTLRIGGVESVCTALLPQLLPELCRLCPKVEVIVRSGPTDDLIELLGSNELDSILTLDEKLLRPELSCQLCQSEEVIFVTRADTILPPEKVIPVESLCRLPFLLTENNASYRYELQRLLAQRDLSIRPILEIGNTETIIALLQQGMGVSFLPRFTVSRQIAEGALIELPTDLPPVYMYHQLFCHKDKWITPQLRIFTDLVRQHFAQETK